MESQTGNGRCEAGNGSQLPSEQCGDDAVWRNWNVVKYICISAKLNLGIKNVLLVHFFSAIASEEYLALVNVWL